MKKLRIIFITVAIVCMSIFAICMILLCSETDILHRTVFYLLQRIKYIWLIIALIFLLFSLVIRLAMKRSDMEMHDHVGSIFSEDDVFNNRTDSNARKRYPNKRKRVDNKDNKTKKQQTCEVEDVFEFDDCINVGAVYPLEFVEDTKQISASRCNYCGSKLSKNSIFCENCGKRV